MSNISLIAKLAKKILMSTKPDYMDSQEKVNEFLELKSKNNEKPAKGIFKSHEFNGMEIFDFGDENSKNLILFIHGGAYVNQINMQHHLYCLKLSRKLDAHVLSPAYPLAPSHNALETLELITELYKTLLEKNLKITIMGDSAGGGFALSFCQYLNTINLPQPNQIIVFSPWVDVSMTNKPYDNENDPILGEIGLKEIGFSWAGNLNPKDYRVSPLYGNNKGLAKTLIFAGDEEIFYKDIAEYVEILKKDGVDIKFITGKGLFHIYPLFPIPEAKKAFIEIEKEF